MCFHKPQNGSVLRLWRIPKPKVAVFLTLSLVTSLSPTYLVAEICSGLRFAYSAGNGSEVIRRTMLPNSRRVRWLSARSSQ